MGRAPTMEGDAAAPRGSNGSSAQCSRPAARKIVLRQFEMHKTGSITFYTLHFTQGLESWSVERRYSEFLRCHVQLLERFSRDDLPGIPPKEPVLQKIFGRGDARSEWAEERRSLLHQYLTMLLAHPGASQSEALLSFMGAPPARGSSAVGAAPGAGVVLISGVRVRLTGEPGGIEVVVRAEAVGVCSVRLALRRLVGERDGELPVMPDLTDLSLEDMEVWERWLELELAESEVGGNSEAAHRFLLEPGSLWQVGAVGVSPDGTTGNAVCIQLRAPTEVEMAQLPRLAAALGGTPEAPASEARAAMAAEGQDEDEEAEEAEDEVWAEAGAAKSVDCGDDGEDGAPSGAEVWAVTHTFSRRTSEPSGSACTSFTAIPEAAEGEGAGQDGEEAQSEAMTEGAGKFDDGPEAQGDSAAEAKSMPAVKAKAKVSLSEEDADSFEAKRAIFLGKDGVRGGLRRGPEIHKVISYKGEAAAEYARRIEEKHRVSLDKVPHRYETTRDGERRSVPGAKLTVVTKDTPPEERRRPPAELLDRGRQKQQMMRLKEEERCAAAWINAVTGDAQAQAAAQDECSLLAALESGEALCDLVNAVWPGRIVGILRGDIKPYKRIANITRFLRACSDLGIPDQNVFTPSDLQERKNLRSVVRCLFALGAIVPESPEYSGPRLEESFDLPPLPKERALEGGASSGDLAGQSASSGSPERRATM